jgi:hypothetical protein
MPQAESDIAPLALATLHNRGYNQSLITAFAKAMAWQTENHGLGLGSGVGRRRGVGLGRGVDVGVAVGVAVGVIVGVAVGVGVGVGPPDRKTRT